VLLVLRLFGDILAVLFAEGRRQGETDWSAAMVWGYREDSVGGGLDCAEDGSRLGHVSVDDCVDMDLVEFTSLADKENSGDGADSRSRSVGTDDVLGLCGDDGSLIIDHSGKDFVVVNGIADSEVFRRPTRVDLTTILLECRAEDVFQVLLPHIEAVVKIDVRYSTH
jgi:hypothetical protein